MGGQAVAICMDAIAAVNDWFMTVLDATGLFGFCLFMAFIALASGFLINRFGSAFSVGSDLASAGVSGARNAFGKGKYGSGRKVSSNPAYKGKYETRRNRDSGHRASPKRNIR